MITLCQIGFYKLLKLSIPKGPALPHVDCWHVKTAEAVESRVLGEAIDALIPYGVEAVSYTHLTLPTKRIV